MYASYYISVRLFNFQCMCFWRIIPYSIVYLQSTKEFLFVMRGSNTETLTCDKYTRHYKKEKLYNIVKNSIIGPPYKFTHSKQDHLALIERSPRTMIELSYIYIYIYNIYKQRTVASINKGRMMFVYFLIYIYISMR